MMSNKKPISPWEKEVKHVSPRTLMIAGLAVLCLICFSAVAMNFDQISAFISGDTVPTDGAGICDPTKDPAYQGNAPIGGGINIESIDYNVQATVEEINDGENWAVAAHIKGNNYSIILDADPGEVWYNTDEWVLSTENFGHLDLTTSENFPWRDSTANTPSEAPQLEAEDKTENQQNVSAADLKQSGTIPTLEQLQKRAISCVYDADGNRYDLFEYIDNPNPDPVKTEFGTVHQGAGSHSQMIEDAELPTGNLYVDKICSGYYLVYPNPEDGEDDIYILFNSGNVHCTKRVAGGMWLGVYDTVLIDKDGKSVNVIDEGPNH